MPERVIRPPQQQRKPNPRNPPVRLLNPHVQPALARADHLRQQRSDARKRERSPHRHQPYSNRKRDIIRREADANEPRRERNKPNPRQLRLAKPVQHLPQYPRPHDHAERADIQKEIPDRLLGHAKPPTEKQRQNRGNALKRANAQRIDLN